MMLKNKKTPIGISLVILLVFSACKSDQNKVTSNDASSGINLAHIDKSVSPKNDFFRYTNGKWVDQTEIPTDKTSWGYLHKLGEQTVNDALQILKEAKNNPALNQNSDQAKAVRLFDFITDTIRRNELGIKPILPYLTKIDAITNNEEVQSFVIDMTPYTGSFFFHFGVRPDSKDSNKNSARLYTGSVGLPDRTYYLENDEKSKEIRRKYVEYITEMLGFIGYNKADATKKATQILAFETTLSENMLDKVARRDPKTTYNPMSVKELKELTPNFDWETYFKGIGITTLDTVVVSEPAYLESLNKILFETDLETRKVYLKWTLLNINAKSLSTEIKYANWKFYQKELRGAKEQEPLEKNALRSVNILMGEALGKLYVEKKFPPEAKKVTQELIANIMEAYRVRIKKLPWMDKTTKEKAIEKINKLRIKVGYPDEWKDYSALEIKPVNEGGSYFENRLNIARWMFNRTIAKLRKPVDKNEWFMPPQTVNAYYNPSYNEIVFPAAILQPPFFNFKTDAAVNYGGIGAVIGHEISHGFDDAGANYDAEGNLINWWTDKDLEQFNRLGDSLASQYSAIEVLPDVFVNGKFTLGENIGDLGGVNAAYDGLQMHLQKNGNPGEIDGFTPEQRFFMSWAIVWRTKTRDEALRNQVKTDPHTPGMYRATQPLINIDAFYEAFDIKEGDGMYLAPEERVKIW